MHTNTTRSALLEALCGIQASKNWSDGRMAEQLRISRPLWGATRRGIVPLQMSVLRGAIRAFPETLGPAIDFLRSGDERQSVKTEDNHEETVRGGAS